MASLKGRGRQEGLQLAPPRQRKGRIYAADRENLTIANIARSSDGDYSPSNARRLVACWNACIGISTENLEDNIPILELAKSYNDPIKQRNELLEALKEVTEILDEVLGFGTEPSHGNIAAKARAAIAKATKTTSNAAQPVEGGEV